MIVLVAFLRYALSAVGWDVTKAVRGTFTTTDLQGRRWRVTCEALEP